MTPCICGHEEDDHNIHGRCDADFGTCGCTRFWALPNPDEVEV